jgi:tetratricopeptide (TPR) repeat protein
MKKFDDAKAYYHKAIDLDPNDPEAYYSIGVIDWTEAYQPRMEARAKLGLRPDEPLKDKKVCQQLLTDQGAAIQDGLDSLNKAIQLRQDYDDAMADEWVDKTMAAKKAKAEKQGPQGIVVDQNH